MSMKIERVVGNTICCNELTIRISVETDYFDGADFNYVSFEIYKGCVLVETIKTNLEAAIKYCNEFGKNK